MSKRIETSDGKRFETVDKAAEYLLRHYGSKAGPCWPERLWFGGKAFAAVHRNGYRKSAENVTCGVGCGCS